MGRREAERREARWKVGMWCAAGGEAAAGAREEDWSVEGGGSGEEAGRAEGLRRKPTDSK